jgi:hypothetical protein
LVCDGGDEVHLGDADEKVVGAMNGAVRREKGRSERLFERKSREKETYEMTVASLLIVRTAIASA